MRHHVIETFERVEDEKRVAGADADEMRAGCDAGVVTVAANVVRAVRLRHVAESSDDAGAMRAVSARAVARRKIFDHLHDRCSGR